MRKPNWILVVDQIEELFTTQTISPAERKLFAAVLGGLARGGDVWVVATLRADFWHRALEVPELAVLSEGVGRLDVSPASEAELIEMIRKPAAAAGLRFEGLHPTRGISLDAILVEEAAASSLGHQAAALVYSRPDLSQRHRKGTRRRMPRMRDL